MLIVQFGSDAVRCSPLSLNQHGACYLVGFGSLLISYLGKKILNKFFKFSTKSFKQQYENKILFM